jgi:hypothetical protein
MWRTTVALAVAPVWRRTPWAPILAAGLAAGGLLWWRAAADERDLTNFARAVAVALAATAAIVVDDPAESISDATTFGRPRRRALGVALTGGFAAAVWTVVIVVASWVAGADEIAAGSQFVEFTGMCVVGWVVGFGSTAVLGTDGASARASVAVPLVVVASAVLPWTRHRLWEPRDHTAHWLAVIGLCVVIGGWVSRDPARRRAAGRG